MEKLIFIFLMTLMLIARVEAQEFNFDFQKNILSRNYTLKISNQDPKRAISFSGCYYQPTTETNYYAIVKDGTKYYFDSKTFCQIGMKGHYWINSGENGKISFRIKKNIVENAVSIIFEGVTFIPVRTGNFVDSTDMRKLLVTYDMQSGASVFKIGEEVMKEPTFSGENFSNMIH